MVVVQTLGSDAAGDATAAPPCAEASAGRSGDPVICRSASATLTIGREGDALVVGDTEVRVYSARLTGRSLVVRMRLRHPRGDASRSPAGRGQLYVRVGGERGDREPLVRRLDPSRAIAVRFRLSARRARELRSGRARAELAVVPWSELGERRPGRLGVVRLDV